MAMGQGCSSEKAQVSRQRSMFVTENREGTRTMAKISYLTRTLGEGVSRVASDSDWTWSWLNVNQGELD